jgi:hypothetical protein
VDTASNSFWTFGGQRVDIVNATSGDEAYTLYSDLWRYDLSTDQWAWIGGNGTTNLDGSWMKGVGAGYPAGRWQSGFVQRNAAGTKIALFGGQGRGSDLGDVWELDVSTPATPVWTWIGGSSGYSAKPVVENDAVGVYHPNNVWGAGTTPAAFGGSGDVAWLFGGWREEIGSCSGGATATTNELWSFNFSAGEFAYWKGNCFDMGGIFGTQGTPGGYPSGRYAPGVSSSNWDSTGKGYLFGGWLWKLDPCKTDHTIELVMQQNDLWEIDSSTTPPTFTFLHGNCNLTTGTPYPPGPAPAPVYGATGCSADQPGGILGGALLWETSASNVYAYAGVTLKSNWVEASYDMLWKYDLSASCSAGAACSVFPVQTPQTCPVVTTGTTGTTGDPTTGTTGDPTTGTTTGTTGDPTTGTTTGVPTPATTGTTGKTSGTTILQPALLTVVVLAASAVFRA